MQATIEQVENVVAILTENEKQLLKDTINHGAWGDTEEEFLDANGKEETDWCYGYCTNDAYKGGHFKGRIVSAMFKSMYRKLCAGERNKIGRYISHCNDWWGDGSGDMLFIRTGYYQTFEEWAKMTAAEEQLKCEPFSKEEFVKVISNRIKDSLSGRASFICDTHIKETRIRCGNTIRMDHEPMAIDYALSEGFRVSYDYNSNGVRYIVFTL